MTRLCWNSSHGLAKHGFLVFFCITLFFQTLNYNNYEFWDNGLPSGVLPLFVLVTLLDIYAVLLLVILSLSIRHLIYC